MESMEAADNALARRRSGSGGAGRTQRSASNHSSSSTSSDILVAPGPSTTAPSKPGLLESPAPAPMARGTVQAEVMDKRILVVKVTGGKNLAVLQMLADHDALNQNRAKKDPLDAPTTTTDGSIKIKDETNESGGDGPNRRGTYSKAYVLQHPEIKWQHRGQGRYLPAPRGGRPSNLIRSQS